MQANTLLSNLKNSFFNIYFVIFSWFIFTIYYAASIKYNINPMLSDKLVFFVQILLDATLFTLVTRALFKKYNEVDSIFINLIFLSIIPGIFTNQVYNITCNILHKTSMEESLNMIWIFSYITFLVFNSSAWVYLIYRKKHKTLSLRRWIVANHVHLLACAVIIISITLTGALHTKKTDLFYFTQIVSSILEMILFIILCSSFSYIKNKAISFVAFGFLLLVSFNLAQRFTYLSYLDYKSFDAIWLISQIFICFGFNKYINQKKENVKNIYFFKDNSLNIFICNILMLFATAIFSVFMLLFFTLSYLQHGEINNLLPNYIPSILIFSYTMSILISRVVALFISNKLGLITKKVHYLMDNNITCTRHDKVNSEILEIKKLDDFIIKTISELKIANKVKSDFLMNMSHDFRTPASGIYHMTKLLHRRVSDSEQKRLLSLTVDSSGQLIKFLDDVLNYSRIDNGQFSYQKTFLDMSEIINNVVALIYPKIIEKNLTIDIKINTENTNIHADKTMLHSIFLNLLSNSVKFTETGGISINVKDAHSNDINYITISISDTGIGIAEEDLLRVFEPFYRVNSPELTDTQHGIGLGLSNSKTMLECMGGRITLKSTLGKGSVFTVYIVK